MWAAVKNFSRTSFSAAPSRWLEVKYPFSILFRHWNRAFHYIFVIVKVPFPVHPDVTPVKVHVPEIVLLFTVP